MTKKLAMGKVTGRGVRKTENLFGFGFGFVQSAIQIKSDKNNFTYIQCGDKVRFKTLPKQSLAFYSAIT